MSMLIRGEVHAHEDPDWELFLDWCSVVGRCALPTTERDILEFLDAAPGARSRKLLAIRRAHESARVAVPGLVSRAAPLLRDGEQWAAMPRALAQLPTLRFPAGLRGRRDGWLMLLVGEMKMSRREALAFHAKLRVDRREPASSCPACVQSRWLRVLGPAYFGDRGEVRAILDPRGADLDIHDCETELDERWQASPTMLPAIDQHGWVNCYRPVSLTTVSAIARARQVLADDPPGPTRAVEMTGRFKDATSDELAAAFDEVDAALEALLARAAAALGDG